MANPINTGQGGGNTNNNPNIDVDFTAPDYNHPCPPGVFVTNSESVAFSGSGSTCDPLSADVILSQQPGNALSILVDGLYADVSASILTRNGIIFDSGFIELGGFLIQDTVIGDNGYALQVGGTIIKGGDDINFTINTSAVDNIDVVFDDHILNYNNGVLGWNHIFVIGSIGTGIGIVVADLNYISGTLLADTSAGDVHITLDPVALNAQFGTIKKISSDANHVVLIAATGVIYDENANAVTSYSFSASGTTRTFQSDGTNIYILNSPSSSSGAGAVTSVFGRVGVVSAQAGDYSSFYYPLASNPAGYLIQSVTDTLYYPLASNPAGYLTVTSGDTRYYSITNPNHYSSGTTAQGPNTSIQYNNFGGFAGSSTFIFTAAGVVQVFPPLTTSNTSLPAFTATNNNPSGGSLHHFGGAFTSEGTYFNSIQKSASVRFYQKPIVGMSTSNNFIVEGNINGGAFVELVRFSQFESGSISATFAGSVAIPSGGLTVTGGLTSLAAGLHVAGSNQFDALNTGVWVGVVSDGSGTIFPGGSFISGVTNPVALISGQLSLTISPTANNRTQVLANGLYSSDFISGVTNPILVTGGVASIKISAVGGNIIQTLSDGLYASGTTGGGGVTSVSNADGTLIISPTTGLVVASLNLAHSNTWTVSQAIASSTVNQTTPFLEVSGTTSSNVFVMLARFIGRTVSSGGLAYTYVKLGSQSTIGSNAYWDWVNDGAGTMYLAYSNNIGTIGSAAMTLTNTGAATFPGRVTASGHLNGVVETSFINDLGNNVSAIAITTGSGTINVITPIGIGNVVGVSSAFLKMAAGTTGVAQINFASGVIPTAPNSGDFTYDGSNFFVKAGTMSTTLDTNAMQKKNASYTLLATDRAIMTDATTSGVTITTPPPASVIGIPFTVKKTDASVNTVTITPASGTIDGAASYVISTRYVSITFLSDGTNFNIV